MALRTIGAEQALANLARFSAVIDARSESEYAIDRLPGALNWPTLSDAQRHEIGTHYKQVSAFEAKKRGAAMAARNIAAHIEREVMPVPKAWKPLLYCWRGGKRSGSLALVLSEIGFEVSVVEGGYKALRAAMLFDTAQLVAQLRFRVVCGPTGSGKTRLLHALRDKGEQVLDLEALAEHRSSVLGRVPGRSQPSQKQFDMRVWQTLKPLSPGRAVWVESESKKVGNVSVPDSLMDALRHSPCVRLESPREDRVQLLLQDYGEYVHKPDYFCERLDVLRDLRGHEAVDRWQAWAWQGEFTQVVRELLEHHYDPSYERSTRRNFQHFGAAPTFEWKPLSQASGAELVERIVQAQPSGAASLAPDGLWGAANA